MRLESHIKDAATDIKECANACDTYMKKRPLVKVLRSAAWDETLKGFVQTFANRKTAFIFALSMHTGIGVDKANDKLDELMARYYRPYSALQGSLTSHWQDGSPTRVFPEDHPIRTADTQNTHPEGRRRRESPAADDYYAGAPGTGTLCGGHRTKL